ncbi:PREDICTED: alpha-ketoglutarate-dependent dioxygenase alkB homolog 7, mitochondrial, partial [Gekko japonicus]|uniref:Alpha-ketoglutarate-dependent dioxygenase alkB homolog 7, mitochondrial n=1 Tax=Gekko japonicus TaxID=146911 RepID=A0ABM1KS54_GEKJA
AIHRYRETEKSHWSQESLKILQRVRDVAFPPHVPQLAQVHVLDLDKTGYIKPHVDSVKHLFSRPPLKMHFAVLTHRGPARYEFTHEILRDEESFFDGQKIPRERRIAIICRNLPLPSS